MPVLMFNPNGTITSRATLSEAALLPTAGMMLMVVTTDQTVSGTVTIPIGCAFSVANGAIITVNSGAVLNIDGEFRAPHEDTWLNVIAGGSVNISATGSRLQGFSAALIGCSGLYADGDISNSGEISAGTRVVAVGNVVAGNNLEATANVVAGGYVSAPGGFYGTASTARDSSGTGNIPAIVGTGMRIETGKANTSGTGVTLITFQQQFATGTIPEVVITPNTSVLNCYAQVTAAGNAGFECYSFFNGTQAAMLISWVAVGKA